MRRIFMPTVLLLFTMALSLGAIAKSKSSEVQIYQTSEISGTTLQPGTYRVMLNTTGSTADVTFSQNGKQVATVTGQLVPLPKKTDSTAITIDTSGTTPRIAEIDLEGSHTGISFSSAPNSASSGE